MPSFLLSPSLEIPHNSSQHFNFNLRSYMFSYMQAATKRLAQITDQDCDLVSTPAAPYLFHQSACRSVKLIANTNSSQLTITFAPFQNCYSKSYFPLLRFFFFLSSTVIVKRKAPKRQKEKSKYSRPSSETYH